MIHSDEQLSLNTTDSIFLKPNPQSRALRAALITGNSKKYQEVENQLGLGYGMDLTQVQPRDQSLLEQCQTIMRECQFSPHFILREETKLISQDTGEDLTHLSIEALAESALENVSHYSLLTVFKPQWQGNDAGIKVLTGFSKRVYQKVTHGYISDNVEQTPSHGFGWDHLFVNASVNLTNEDFIERYGKQSARQQVFSDFILTYLRYKSMLTLKYHELPQGEHVIEFADKYISLRDFIQHEPHFSNPYVNDWFVGDLVKAMVNEGMFLKGALSRPVKNFFSPPFSGIPLTAKKDMAEETIFMTHDMLHHLVPDLVCDRPKEQSSYFVYAAWRMISEACTMVFADMLYADGLIKNGVDRSGVDKRIYPLFEQIKLVQGVSDPALLTKEQKINFIEKLLHANVRYALLGDDSNWQGLLSKEGESALSSEALAVLEAYKSHFGKFFIGDNAWTKANYDNMHTHIELIHQWVDRLGKATFKDANILLLSEVTNSLKKSKVDFSDYASVVDAVFNFVFDKNMLSHIQDETLRFEDDALVQSRAFKRFMIGQTSMFSHYPVPPNCQTLLNEITQRLKQQSPFSADEQTLYRNKLHRYINAVRGQGLMTPAEAMNAKDCFPVFPPVYISYPAMQEQYETIAACVQENISEYGCHLQAEPGSELIAKNVNGITFIDIDALERATDPTLGAHSLLQQKMRLVGVEFWDEEKRIVKKPVVGICAIGGIPLYLSKDAPEGSVQLRFGNTISAPISINELHAAFQQTMGMQSTHTYQNPFGKTPQELYQKTVELGHLSITHAGFLNIAMYGISKLVELELDSQRDHLHLARETSARADCQSQPCVFAMTEQGVLLAKDELEMIDKRLARFRKDEGSKLDYLEERNSFYPLSAVQSIGINASLKHLKAVVQDIGGSGKEKQYRDCLVQLNDSLHAFLPEVFPASSSYGYLNPLKRKIEAAENVAKMGLFSNRKPSVTSTKPAILLLGPPMIGKSTQMQLVKAQYPQMMSVSTGELARALLKRVENHETDFTDVERKAIGSLDAMKNGRLMEDDAIYNLLFAHLSKGGKGYDEFQACDLLILDGVIKQASNIASFNRALEKFNCQHQASSIDLQKVIMLDAPDEVLFERHRIRAASESRQDDGLEKYQSRLSQYRQNQAGLKQAYNEAKLDHAVADIDASYTAEKTSEALLSAIDTSNKMSNQMR